MRAGFYLKVGTSIHAFDPVEVTVTNKADLEKQKVRKMQTRPGPRGCTWALPPGYRQGGVGENSAPTLPSFTPPAACPCQSVTQLPEDEPGDEGRLPLGTWAFPW